ncbi:unnamed protein product [Oreochromis niloticus]|nr:unnamed protein product [Mustela putorius furo]
MVQVKGTNSDKYCGSSYSFSPAKKSFHIQVLKSKSGCSLNSKKPKQMLQRLFETRLQLRFTAEMTLQRRQPQWKPAVFLCCFLLGISLQSDNISCVSTINLRRFIGCAVREFTFLARKPGCGSLHITTDACWGRCETWEKPILEPPFIESYQRVCTYNETRLETVKLPNCQPNVDPTYTYPVALRCDCGVCLTSTTECITSV